MERQHVIPLVIEVDFKKHPVIERNEWFILNDRKCRLLYTDTDATIRYGHFEYEDGERFIVTHKAYRGTIDHDVIYWNRIVGWSLCLN